MDRSTTTANSEEATDAVSYRIVRQLASRSNRDLTQLPPLYETVDAEALDRLVESIDPEHTSLSLTLTYANHRVTVDADGTVSCSQDGGRDHARLEKD